MVRLILTQKRAIENVRFLIIEYIFNLTFCITSSHEAIYLIVMMTNKLYPFHLTLITNTFFCEIYGLENHIKI